MFWLSNYVFDGVTSIFYVRVYNYELCYSEKAFILV